MLYVRITVRKVHFSGKTISWETKQCDQVENYWLQQDEPPRGREKPAEESNISVWGDLRGQTMEQKWQNPNMKQLQARRFS